MKHLMAVILGVTLLVASGCALPKGPRFVEASAEEPIASAEQPPEAPGEPEWVAETFTGRASVSPPENLQRDAPGTALAAARLSARDAATAELVAALAGETWDGQNLAERLRSSGALEDLMAESELEERVDDGKAIAERTLTGAAVWQAVGAEPAAPAEPPSRAELEDRARREAIRRARRELLEEMLALELRGGQTVRELVDRDPFFARAVNQALLNARSVENVRTPDDGWRVTLRADTKPIRDDAAKRSSR